MGKLSSDEIRDIETEGATRVANGENSVRWYDPIIRSDESIDALERGGEKMAEILHRQELNTIARKASE